MCIVSFVLKKEKFILTFNRDENINRASKEPAWRLGNNLEVFGPVDEVGGGSWIGYNKKIAACLQNGAKNKHIRQMPYRKSRGLILKEILEADAYEKLLSSYKFDNIEPFTLSIFDVILQQLFIYRFDGTLLISESNDLKDPLVIASSTLYPPNAQNAIIEQFNDILLEKNVIFDFHDEHRIGKIKNTYTDLVSTVSITQFVIEHKHIDCHYFDTINNKHFYYKT